MTFRPDVPVDLISLRHLAGRDWESGSYTFVVQRQVGGSLREVGRFHDADQAADWADEAVAHGEGSLEDYSSYAIPHSFRAKHRWARVLLAAAVGAFVVVMGLVFLYLVFLVW